MVISGLGKCGSGCRCKRMERTKVGWADGHKRGEVSGVDERRKGSLMRWIFVSFQRGLILLERHALFGGVIVNRLPKGPQKFRAAAWKRHILSTVYLNQCSHSVHWFRYTVGSIVVVTYLYIYDIKYFNLSKHAHTVMLERADAEGSLTCL